MGKFNRLDVWVLVAVILILLPIYRFSLDLGFLVSGVWLLAVLRAVAKKWSDRK